ncbi:MAG: hypothetical protein QOD75_2746 [Blastocatellia bacterium]|jgi:hypothetical protein|nr:hypothetical protein [Blastocatellia bacterium]
MVLLALGKHWMYDRPDGQGGTISYYYSDTVIWVLAALSLIWGTWFLINIYRRARALRRPPQRSSFKSLKRIIKLKRELSSRYLRPGFSTRIHAVGIGRLPPGDEYCLQVFINAANDELWSGAGAASFPDSYRGVPLIAIEMPAAGFLPGMEGMASEQYANGIREYQDVIIGGISGANANLDGQSGTIGYFCKRKTKLRRRKEIHLLSNSHVFADLRKATVDEADLIMQPSPGEPGSNRPIASLVNFSNLKFDGDITDPNSVDAAVAKLWGPQRHNPVIPMIGGIKGYVPKRDIEVGEAARKFGRTTGYTEGNIFSIYLDIWIRYDRTGQSAFFHDQFLIAPAEPAFTKFVDKGDSGSLVVDADQHALGLIFAGMADAPEVRDIETIPENDPAANNRKRLEGYGVANSISEVMQRLNIELQI